MFLDPLKIPFLDELISNKELLFSEFENAKKSEQSLSEFLETKDPTFPNHTKYWVLENYLDADQTGYDLRNGLWSAYPLFKKNFPISWYPVEKRFPLLTTLFKKNPAIEFACFMRLESLAETKPHVHSRQHLIFHLLMNDLDNDGCIFTCNGHVKLLRKKGEFLMFDYSLEHSTQNTASVDRINLVIDFKL